MGISFIYLSISLSLFEDRQTAGTMISTPLKLSFASECLCLFQSSGLIRILLLLAV